MKLIFLVVVLMALGIDLQCPEYCPDSCDGGWMKNNDVLLSNGKQFYELVTYCK